MSSISVLLNFKRFPVSEKISFYRNVVARITGNSYFATPDVALTDATALVNGLETSYLAAQDGSRTAKSLMREKEGLADDCFRKIANYVDRIADGDETKILSSGFNASKPFGIPHRTEFSVEQDGISGEVNLRHKAISGARAYVWQLAKDQLPVSENDWSFCGHSTKASIRLSNLSSGSRYWFRVAAVTISGTMPYSQPLMKIVE